MNRAKRDFKKSLGVIGTRKPAQKGELAHQLSRPNGPYNKSQGARALQVGRATLYWPSRQAVKDKQVAVALEAWHEIDDTLGHRKLAALLKMSKDRVRRVMPNDGIMARRKRKKEIDPGRASEIAPNLLRELTEGSDPEIVFSDILEVKLADGTKVRGCFALWKRTRHLLGLAFEYPMRAELVTSALQTLSFDVPEAIFHRDQGKQFGAKPTRELLLNKGFQLSRSPGRHPYGQRLR